MAEAWPPSHITPLGLVVNKRWGRGGGMRVEAYRSEPNFFFPLALCSMCCVLSL